MATLDCNPATLIQGSTCFWQCIPPGMTQAVMIYLLQQIAKDNKSPNDLMDAAKCIYQCVPKGMEGAIINYLLCQAANSGGTSDVQDFGVRWEPSNLELGKLTGLRALGSATGITSITFQWDTANGIDFNNNSPNLQTFSAPNLVSLTPPGYFRLNGATNLTSFSAPLLTTCDNGFIVVNSGLTTLSLPSLISAVDMFIENNSLLATFDIPSFVPSNGQNIFIDSNALNASSVNAVLARCVANAGYVSGTVDLSGGTNAAPTGQGLVDKATLIGRGVTVSTN